MGRNELVVDDQEMTEGWTKLEREADRLGKAALDAVTKGRSGIANITHARLAQALGNYLTATDAQADKRFDSMWSMAKYVKKCNEQFGETDRKNAETQGQQKPR